MMNQFVDTIVNKLIRDEAIEEEDKELYQFGLWRGIILLLNLIVAAIIGLCMGRLWQMFVFLICFAPLRVYSGGYHEKTQLRCFITTLFMLVAVMCMIKYVTFPLWICAGVIIVVGACIFLLAPMEHENRLFEYEELKIYKKIARSIWGTEAILLMMLCGLGLRQISDCMAVGFIFISLLLILGKLEKSIHRKKNLLK